MVTMGAVSIVRSTGAVIPVEAGTPLSPDPVAIVGLPKTRMVRGASTPDAGPCSSPHEQEAVGRSTAAVPLRPREAEVGAVIATPEPSPFPAGPTASAGAVCTPAFTGTLIWAVERLSAPSLAFPTPTVPFTEALTAVGAETWIEEESP
jgi:hypothetical protein